MVKLAQKQGLKGTKGDWKEFLRVHDRKLGSSLSDPTRRSNDVLAAFLKTFVEENHLKVFPFYFWNLFFSLLLVFEIL